MADEWGSGFNLGDWGGATSFSPQQSTFNFDWSLPSFGENSQNWSPQGLPSPDYSNIMNTNWGQSAQAQSNWTVPTSSWMPQYSSPDMSSIQSFLQQDRSIPNLSEGWYQGALNRGGGDYGQAGQWLGALRESGRPGWNMDPALRNAQHAMGQMELGQRAPGFGGLNAMTGVPAYSLAKLILQRMYEDQTPGSPLNPLAKNLNSISQYLGGDSGNLLKASKPTWDEVWWGMRPLWSRR